MTLHSRNRIFFAAILLSALFTVGIIIVCLCVFLSGSQIRFPEASRLSILSSSFFLVRYSSPSVIISIIIFGLYVPLSMLLIYQHFEKTQSPEIIYFFGFLIGCVPEIIRLLIITFNLGEGYSQFLFFAYRAIFAGRVMTTISLMILAIFAGTHQTQDADRNFVLILICSVIFALLIPINASTYTSTGIPEYSFSKLITAFHILFCLITFSTLLLNGIQHKAFYFKHAAFFYLILFLGYTILKYADCLLFLILGVMLFFFGSWQFNRSIHRYYLWK